MHKTIKLIERNSRIAQSLVLDDLIQNDTALDEFHFGSGRRRDIKQRTHFAKSKALLISLNIYLEKNVALKGRANPHCGKAAKNNAKEQENEQEFPLAFQIHNYLKNIDFAISRRIRHILSHFLIH